LGYDEYCSLLLAAAVSHDEQYKPKITKRQVFNHDTHINEDIQCEDDDQYDIDYPASSLQAFATNFCNRPSMRSSAPKFTMCSDKWNSPDDKSKDIWDRLDEKAKSIILGYSNDRPPSLQQRASANGSSYSISPPPQ
jgi:hypothetical protein